MKAAENFIANRLAERREAGNLRALKPEGNLIDFCSNDYLGFARSAELKKAVASECSANHALNGATGSRLISGNLKYTEAVEQQIAQWFDSEASLLFNSGYDANVGLLSSLPQRGDTIICDELIHASAIDGARLSYANRFSFKHNDVDSLEAKLKNAKGVCYVVIESVYSMDGDSPPLIDIVEMTEKYKAHLIVDEAHAFGLYKRGLVSELGLQHRVFARLITFGKALGGHGAAIVGSSLLRNYLINFARSFIYTTAAPFHQVAAIKTGLDLLNSSDDMVDQLKHNIALFKALSSPEALQIMPPSNSPIQCVVLTSALKATTMATALQNKGFDVRAILSPTVAEGSERLRICLHAFNTDVQVKQLTEIINPSI
ncbi:aminotransferase class I/II-fold pyridoxal phosphate-dependent enzyme [Mucilaginibacter calamicampi]|uniref:Aminotransferase class I/II-fold pyridoxal phosphate-dependent enzyme n=1 Tax=Mucilaginibacter calamicampi TaxID=1302352 RepID=A0ABW2YTV0_9SPHI